MTAALMCAGIQDLAVAGVDVYFVKAGVFAHGQHRFPGLPSVGGFVDAPVTARRPQGTVRGHINDIGIGRVNGDHSDVFGILQSHVFPAFATVVRAVHPVAIGHAPLVVILARTDPNRVWVGGVDADTADRIAALVLEHGFISGPRVGGFPYPARGGCHVIFRGVRGVHFDVGHATGSQCRTDGAEAQAAECRGTEGALFRCSCGAGFLLCGKGHTQQ